MNITANGEEVNLGEYTMELNMLLVNTEYIQIGILLLISISMLWFDISVLTDKQFAKFPFGFLPQHFYQRNAMKCLAAETSACLKLQCFKMSTANKV